MTWRLRSVDQAGVQRWTRPDGNGGVEIRLTQDVEPMLDAAKAMANHNDGYSASREFRRVAHIPDGVRLKLINEQGWDPLDPACADRLLRLLNDPDWQYLRTAPGRLAMSNGIIR